MTAIGLVGIANVATQQGVSRLSIGNLLWQLFYGLFMFALVAALAIIVTRLWARKASPFAVSRGRNLQMLEYMPLGTGKGLYLLRVPEGVILVGVTEHGVALIKEYPATVDLLDLSKNLADQQLPAWLARLIPNVKHPESESRATVAKSSDRVFGQELLQRIRDLKEPKE